MTLAKGGEAFRPSWIDRFNNWVEQLRVKPWVFYIILGIVLVLVQLLFLWIEGGSFANQLLPVIIFNGLAVPVSFKKSI